MTKLLADENVPIEAVKILKSWSIDIVSIIDFSPGLSDRDVINLSSREDRILITFDKDLGELVVRERMKVKGLILLRFIPKSTHQIAEKIRQILTSQIPIENSLLIVKEHAIRVIKLKY